jgi:NADH:ubiquinone reductase (non-electrogenic)
MAKLPTTQMNKRGITVDGMFHPFAQDQPLHNKTTYFSLQDHLRMVGSSDIFAVGDCTASSYAPTAQVASQQGKYLAHQFALFAKKDAIEAKLAALQTAPETEETQAKTNGLLKQLDKLKLRPFHYSHQGSLAYVFFATLK